MTAINIVDLIAMMIATVMIYSTLLRLGISFPVRIVGCVLFVVSFPAFYYGTIGYCEPVLICALAIGVYLIFANKWLLFAITIAVGAFANEKVVLVNLVVVVYLFVGRRLRSRRDICLCLGFLVVYVTCTLVARQVIPVSGTYLWTPSLERLLLNATRLRSWLSFVLSFGPPGFLALLAYRLKDTEWFGARLPETAALTAGVVLSVLLFGYSMLSASADGRFVWTSYPFSIPLAAATLDHVWKRRLSMSR